jgi:hypothetical protein
MKIEEWRPSIILKKQMTTDPIGSLFKLRARFKLVDIGCRRSTYTLPIRTSRYSTRSHEVTQQNRNFGDTTSIAGAHNKPYTTTSRGTNPIKIYVAPHLEFTIVVSAP